MHFRCARVWACGPLAALAVAACVPAPGAPGAPAASAPPSSAPNALASPVPSPSPVLSTSATAASNGANANAAVPPASFDVSPAHVELGGLTLSLDVEPARHLLSPSAAPTADPDPAHLSEPSGATQAAAGSTVLDGMLRVTNNLDPSQPAPADLSQVILRHAAVHVRTADLGVAVPYLAVSMDMLLDGHPAISDQAMVPMVASEASAPDLYYGNNIKLAQRGIYQVFVRIQRSALLGKDQPQAAQFNLSVH